MVTKKNCKWVEYTNFICIFYVLCTGHHTLTAAASVQQYASIYHSQCKNAVTWLRWFWFNLVPCIGVLVGKSNLSEAKSFSNRCEPDVACTQDQRKDSASSLLQELWS